MSDAGAGYSLASAALRAFPIVLIKGSSVYVVLIQSSSFDFSPGLRVLFFSFRKLAGPPIVSQGCS